MRKWFLILALLAAPVLWGQTYGGLLTAARSDAAWPNAGATIPSGTIPNCTTQPSANTPAAITTAFNADAGGASYCQINIPAGTFNVTGTIQLQYAGKANVVLNGAGPNQTFFVWNTTSGTTNCNGLQPTFLCPTNGDGNANVGGFNWPNSASVTSGYAQGSTSLVLSNVTNLHVGYELQMAQADPASDNGNTFFCALPIAGTPGVNGDCSQQGSTSSPRLSGVYYSESQMFTVTNISGTTVTVTPPVKAPNWNSGQTPRAWWTGVPPVQNIGIQNISLDTSAISSGSCIIIEPFEASNVWLSNVRTVNATCSNAYIALMSVHNTIQNSYLYGSTPTSGAYGVDFAWGTSDSLALNNITQHIAAGFITETSVGNVFAYNFSVDDNNSVGWQAGDNSLHAAGDYYNLFEGNQGISGGMDDIHGTSPIGNTWYRPFFSCFDDAAYVKNGNVNPDNMICIKAMSYARYSNWIAGVFGTTGKQISYQSAATTSTQCNVANNYGQIWQWNISNQNNSAQGPACGFGTFSIPNDLLVLPTAARWGNWDNVTNGVRECKAGSGSPCTTDETACSASTYPGVCSPSTTFLASFIFSSTPSFWTFPSGSTAPFPAVGPDVTGGNIANVGGHAWLNPANNCYHNVMHGLDDGSSGPLTYNANNCYTGSTPTLPGSTFSPVSGTYGSTQNVTVSNSISGTTQCVTTDGTTPTETGHVCSGGTTFTYTTPITVATTATIRVLPTKSGYNDGPILGGTWIIGTPTLSAPTLSPNTPPNQYLTLPTVTPSCSAGATSCTTTDGSTPTATTPGTCSNGSSSSVSPVSGTPVKSLCTEIGYNNSSITSVTYTQVPIQLDVHGNFNGGNLTYTTVTIGPLTPHAGDGETCELDFGSTATATVTDNVNSGGYPVAIPLHLNTTIGASIGMWYRSNVAGNPTTITATLSGARQYVGFSCEFWQPATAGTFVLDTTFTSGAQQDGTTANPTIGTARTPTNSNELVLGNMQSNTQTPTAGANFTLVDTNGGGPNLWPQYWIQTTPTATNSPYVMVADPWTDQMAAFRFSSTTTPAPTGVSVIVGQP